MPICFCWAVSRMPGPNFAWGVENEIEREEDGVERIAVHGRYGGFLGVDGEPDVPDLAFLLRSFHGFHRAARAEDFV